MKFDVAKLKWVNQPNVSRITPDEIIITTDPETDFWQRTYYGFRNDNAHALVMSIEGDFSFAVKTQFDSKMLFDQCGIVIYQDSDNWFKASIEYENDEYQRLGSVVTNHGYSDWATTDISAEIRQMVYRLSRRGSDFLIENSIDGQSFSQMRVFHLFEGDEAINVGVYACSPLKASFDARFTEMKLSECLWKEHVRL